MLQNDVDIWCTMNEPMVVAVTGYFMGEFPPMETSFIQALKVGRNIIRIHAAAYKVLKEKDPNKLVGMVKSTPLFQPLENKISDRIRCKYADHIFSSVIL